MQRAHAQLLLASPYRTKLRRYSQIRAPSFKGGRNCLRRFCNHTWPAAAVAGEWIELQTLRLAGASRDYAPSFALIAARRTVFWSIQEAPPSQARRWGSMGTGVEYRIMPTNGDGRWYWEVIRDGCEVVARGIADTEPAACEQAGQAARKAKLIEEMPTHAAPRTVPASKVQDERIAAPGLFGRVLARIRGH
jgi:hypothetical protein